MINKLLSNNQILGQSSYLKEGTNYPIISTTNRQEISKNTDYTLTQDCWIWWGNTYYVGNRTFYINSIEIGRSYGNSGAWEEFNSLLIPLKAGNIIKHTGDSSLCYIYPSSNNLTEILNVYQIIKYN